MNPMDADKLESLFRHLQVAKRRGDQKEQARLLEELQQAAPESPLVREAIADDLVDRGQTQAALEEYGKILTQQPDNIAVQKKHADLVFRSQVGSADFSSTLSEFEVAASGKTASVLSSLLPGLGQITLGEVVKGGVLMGLYLLGWIGLFLVPNGLSGLLGLVGFARPGPFNGLVFLPLLLIAGAYMVSLFDISATAKRFTRKPVERPKPPVDKDFEI